MQGEQFDSRERASLLFEGLMDPEMMKMAMDAMSKMTPQQVSFSYRGCVIPNPILKPFETKGILLWSMPSQVQFCCRGSQAV